MCQQPAMEDKPFCLRIFDEVHRSWYRSDSNAFQFCNDEDNLMANKEQKKEQKAAPKSNKQKKEASKEKKAAKLSGGTTLNKEP
jgi:hypothetical protein